MPPPDDGPGLDLGARLRAFRTRAGLSQQSAATRAGLSTRALRDLERGRVRQPRTRTLRRLGEVLGLTEPELTDLQLAVRTGPPAGAALPHLLILGPLAVQHGRATTPVTSPMLRRLLGLLALQHPEPATRQEITDTLWPAGPPDSHQSLVHTYISQLRRLLEPAGPPHPAVVRTPTGYRLDTPRRGTDLGRFDELLARTTSPQHPPDPGTAFETLTRALHWWRGPVLADADPALRRHPAAVAAGERRIRAALLHADTALLLHRADRSVPVLRALTHTEPLHEGLHARLILALAADGEQAAALDVFTRLRTRLAEDLGVDPGPDLRDAHVRVLRRRFPTPGPAPAGEPINPALRPTQPPPAAADPSGRQAEPHAPLPATSPSDPPGLMSHPAQLPSGSGDLPGLQADLPAPLTATAPASEALGEPPRLAFRPAQLPAAADDLFGRQGELHALDALLPGGPTRRVHLLAVVGPPGVGKTALAAHWAHQRRAHFPDGQLYVDLRGHSPLPPQHPGDVLAAFLRALGVPSERLPADQDEAAALYRSVVADRRMLVVLDNAQDAAQVRPLIPGARGCAVLVTSRSRLAALVAGDGARRLALDALGAEDGARLLADVLGACRVAAEPEAARRLVRACGGLPLAIRIAGARLAAHHGAFTGHTEPTAPTAPTSSAGHTEPTGPTELAGLAALSGEELLDRLHLDGDRNAAVRGAFDLSYRALAAPARRMFRLLGLAPGPAVTAEAAAALADTSAAETTALLDTLADGHLVRPHPADRYEIPGLLRPFARSLADPAEAGPARHRLYRRYLRHQGPAAWPDGERADLADAAVQACDTGSTTVARKLAERLSAAGAPAGSDRRTTAHPEDISTLGLICWKLGRLDEAAEHFAHAARLLHGNAPADREAVALTNLAVVRRAQGHPAEVIRALGETMPLHRRCGNRFSEAVALNCLSAAHTDLGDHAAGRLLAHNALTTARTLRNRALAASAQLALAAAHERAHRPTDAVAAHREALHLAEASGDRYPQAAALAGLALVQAGAGEPRAAVRAAERALALAREAGYRMLEGCASTALALARTESGDSQGALGPAHEALALHQDTGHRTGEARTHLVLARAHSALGAAAPAVGHRREALRLSRAMGGVPLR
ncbi:BTAD domain-containing putative transcriptional regulator [Streptomyces sp. TLI_171]|uniref:BTAD domain-containing putative transcriptional regulator n=1 Tax=Streptomyces sp. TLI_171 TaxID=1938859 RepID=UPI00217DF8ED|nr:BTAD domain-containing putative transcriptional regulator [Streptomyces sp. TLI_171]